MHIDNQITEGNKFKLGDYAVVVNYPNHYSKRHSGEVVKIEKSELPGDFEITIKTFDGEMSFLESSLKMRY